MNIESETHRLSAASSPSSASSPPSAPGRRLSGRRRRATAADGAGSSQATASRLPRRLALGVFSSDALSSTAYATEEILRVLILYSVTAGIGANGTLFPALGLAWPLALGIALLLIIVT